MSRIALATGANRGLGLEISRQLARAGLTVILGARDPRKGAAAVNSLRAEGSLDVETVQLDVADEASVARAAATVAERHGRLDVLVNNAGILPEAVAETSEVVDLDLFRSTLETNLLARRTTPWSSLPIRRRRRRSTA